MEQDTLGDLIVQNEEQLGMLFLFLHDFKFMGPSALLLSIAGSLL